MRATATPLRCSRLQPVRILSVTGTSAGPHRRLEDRGDQRLVAQQRGARVPVADFLRRAAHVDVDDLRAGVDVAPRRLGHRHRVAARDLHDARFGLACVDRAAGAIPRCPQSRGSAEIISPAARAAPMRRQSLRNGRSVTPAIGARSARPPSRYGPMAMTPHGLSPGPARSAGRRPIRAGRRRAGNRRRPGRDRRSRARRPRWRRGRAVACRRRRALEVLGRLEVANRDRVAEAVIEFEAQDRMRLGEGRRDS